MGLSRLTVSVVTVCLLCLNACTTLPHLKGSVVSPSRDALQSFAFDGRFSLRYAEKNYAGRLSWQHNEHSGGQARDALLIASPLGQGIAELSSDSMGARLRASDGKSYFAADAETLIQQVLGYPLPLARLADWLGAQKVGAEVGATDAFGRPLRLLQNGWCIDYVYNNEDPQAPPARLTITYENTLELRLRIDTWYDPNAVDDKP